MNHLLRELAPMSESAWAEVDKEARQRLRPVLAARRLVDFIGPAGWGWRPSFHGWRLRRGEGNWDEVGAEAEAVGVRVRDKRTEAGRGAERARELRNGETQREKYT